MNLLYFSPKGTAESTHLKLASAGNIDLSQAYGSGRRTQSGKFTLAQLRATEGYF
jgi:hypothetical protein